MAVIRQRTTVFNKPVGVVRSNVGSQQIGEAISRSVSGIQRIAFGEASALAEKKGTDFAKALDLSKFRAIDPTTGRITKFAEPPMPPNGFGSVAARAYQNVIDRRYEASINNEIEIKAKETAIKYPFDSDSYVDVMADYVANLSENSIDKYKSLIEESGKLFIANSKNAIDKNIFARSQTNASASIDEGLVTDGIRIKDLASQGPLFQEDVDKLIEKSTGNATNGVASGLKPEGFDSQALRANKLEAAKGSIDYLLSTSIDSSERKEIQLAISTRGTQMGSLSKEKQTQIQRIVSLSQGNINAAYSYSVTGSTPYDSVETERETAQAEREIEFFRDFRIDLKDLVFNPEPLQAAIGNGINEEIFSSVKDIATLLDRKIAVSESFYDRQTDKTFYSQPQRDADILSLKQRALYPLLVEGAIRGNQESFVLAITTGQPEHMAELDDTQKLLVRSLIKTGLFDRKTDELNKFVSSTANDTISNLQIRQDKIKKESQLNKDLSTFFEHVNAGGSLEGAEDVLSFDELNKLIDNAELEEIISSEQARRNRSNLRSQASNSYIVNFSEGATSRDMSDLQTFVDTSGKTVEGADGRVFTKKVIEAGNKILENKENAAEINAAVSKIGGIRAIKAQDESVVAARNTALEEQMELGNRLTSNSLNPNDSKDQEFVDTYIEGTFKTVLDNMGIQSAEQMFNDSRMFTTDEGQKLLSLIGKLNAMPASLKAAFESLSDGQFLGNNPQVLLSHFANFYEYESEGITMSSPMMDSLSDEAYSTLEYLYDAGRTGLLDASDPSSIQRILQKKQKFENDPLFKQIVETKLDSSLEDFVMSVDNINNMPLSAVNGLKALTLNLVSLEGENFKPKKIKDFLERQLKKRYPDGGGIVFGAGGSRNTIAPLARAAGAGNEDLFKIHIMNEVRRANPKEAKTFILGVKVPAGVRVGRDGFLGVPTDMSTEALREFRRQNIQAFNDEGNIFLKPIGVPSSGLIQYAVFQKVPVEEGGSIQIMKTVETGGPSGQRETFKAPLIISNRDPAFVEAVSKRRIQETQTEISTAKQIFSSPRTVNTDLFQGGGFLAFPEGSIIDPAMRLN